MDRRQFFKTVAATAVGAVVAPAVVGGGKTTPVGVGNRAKYLVYGDPGIGKTPLYTKANYELMNQLFGAGRYYSTPYENPDPKTCGR